MTKIALASDHAGFHLKALLVSYLQKEGYEVTDFGTNSDDPADYPDHIRPAAISVAAGHHDCAIVIGGSGNGEAMVANKVRGVRCALCWNRTSARLAKEHNNANVIALGARMISEDEALAIVDTWLKAEFHHGRHTQRINKLEADGTSRGV